MIKILENLEVLRPTTRSAEFMEATSVPDVEPEAELIGSFIEISGRKVTLVDGVGYPRSVYSS